jgi:hypothetical protein
MAKSKRQEPKIKKDSALRYPPLKRPRLNAPTVGQLKGEAYIIEQIKESRYFVSFPVYQHFGFGIIMQKNTKGDYKIVDNASYKELESTFDSKIKKLEEAKTKKK